VQLNFVTLKIRYLHAGRSTNKLSAARSLLRNPSAKVITFRPTILVLLEFQFLRQRADFIVYIMLEAYFRYVMFG